jgi:hypothetical protein
LGAAHGRADGETALHGAPTPVTGVRPSLSLHAPSGRWPARYSLRRDD